MMKIRGKIRSCAGFTLAETMLATLILLLVTVIVANGIPVAKNAYEKVVVASNAQALLSTTVAALRDELGTAWDVSVDDAGTTLTYYSADTGARCELSNYEKEDVKYIQLKEFMNASDLGIIGLDADEVSERPLVSRAAATSKLYAKYDNVILNDDSTVTFTNLKVYKAGAGEKDADLASLPPVSVTVKNKEGGTTTLTTNGLVVHVFTSGEETIFTSGFTTP